MLFVSSFFLGSPGLSQVFGGRAPVSGSGGLLWTVTMVGLEEELHILFSPLYQNRGEGKGGFQPACLCCRTLS